ncbi:MAG: ATP synthase F1 subunit gamma [Clostridia bacterium]|nr:ATP synthase F1 subunit gamma [Clostridia bacterium]
MGADTKALRNRIKSVDSTLHLTKAMGLVASSKIRGATLAMNRSREYLDSVTDIISLVSSSPECARSPYMREAESDRTKIIVIAGDRGLAGGYNANVFREAAKHQAEFIPIGKRACERFGAEINSSEKFSGLEAYQLAKELCAQFCDGEYDRLGIISTRYVSMMKQEAFIKWILPLEKSEPKSGASIVFEPDERYILDAAVPEYVTGVIMAAVRESYTSEVVARRMAMDSAGKNAQVMIDDLQLEYNRARQGAITQEITEIIAGSGA